MKIVASDAPSNAPGTALAGELDSSAFEIDNTRARRSRSSNVRVDRGRTIVTFDVKDDHSPIQRVEFSQDGQRWRGVFPGDGIADSRDEHYELAVDGELGDRGSDAARDRCDEQRRDRRRSIRRRGGADMPSLRRARTQCRLSR